MTARVFVAAVIAVATISSPTNAAVPRDGGQVGGATIPIAVRPGDQTDVQVSGDLATFTEIISSGVAGVRFFRFSTGVETAIAPGPGGFDRAADVDDGRIVFSRMTGTRFTTAMYDVATAGLTTFDPDPDGHEFANIGRDTVALLHYDDVGNDTAVEVYDTVTGSARRFGTMTAHWSPRVAPEGDVVVWEACEPWPSLQCGVQQAVRTGDDWELSDVTATSNFASADTDGTYVVYHDANPRTGVGGRETDIYFRPVAGGPETRLTLPGYQLFPRIDDGLIVFQSGPTAVAPRDAYIYSIARDTLWRVTDTPQDDEVFVTLDVLPTGEVRMAWGVRETVYPGTDFDLYARTFRLPAADATPPVVTPRVTGALGDDGWYTSDVALRWELSDLESPYTTTGCTAQMITADQPASEYACTATSAGGTAGPVTTSIKRDATAPTVTLGAPAASYRVDQTVSLACNATDALSGVAQPCAPIDASAWSFGAGPETVTRTARDRAGNVGSASATFTVTVDAASLTALTRQFVQTSANYQRLGPAARRLVDALVTSATAFLTRFGPNALPAFKAQFIDAYQAAVQTLVTPGWLTQAQADTLAVLADAL